MNLYSVKKRLYDRCERIGEIIENGREDMLNDSVMNVLYNDPVPKSVYKNLGRRWVAGVGFSHLSTKVALLDIFKEWREVKDDYNKIHHRMTKIEKELGILSRLEWHYEGQSEVGSPEGKHQHSDFFTIGNNGVIYLTL